MRIRQMFMEDVPAVANIEKECFSSPWSESAFADAVRDKNAIFFVAEEAGTVTGYIGMYVSPPEGEITNVAVAENFRNRGCGKKLLCAMQNWAGDNGITRIVLEVRSSNDAAVHVYLGAGFYTLGVRKNFYQFPREDADIMEWQQNRKEIC